MNDQNLISESSTLEEFDKRLKEFRRKLYGRCPSDAESNGHYLAWCYGVKFGRDHVLRIIEKQ